MRLLLLRLEGPLQSWGENSRWDTRDSASMPTKSGVIGVIACCLGIPRGNEKLELLNRRLSVSVRADRPGISGVDFHTVTSRTMELADGSKKERTIVSHRQYLQDASFLAAVACEDGELLDQIAAALRHPVWVPYLGRKSCVPTVPILELDTDTYASVEETFEKHPLAQRSEGAERIYAQIECPDGVLSRRDVLEKAGERRFAFRTLRPFVIEQEG